VCGRGSGVFLNGPPSVVGVLPGFAGFGAR
jgi:hypothetical protein